ncbi:anthranilate phosphoribosyltransferase [Desulfovibrio sp. OttesenSCG-928-A18]|nr:anthranilate phosphoribosyltransferase [Desulfovibrio sp. OttesenSCG-928-A18]
MIKNILSKLTGGKELDANEVAEFISAVNNDEVSEVQISAFQVALMMKGPTMGEISAIATSMRANCVKIAPKVGEDLMDTCGTGGGLSTFNISTAAAIVAACAGIPLAKHGSRSIASLSGSADVLETLGVEIKLAVPDVEKMIEEIGISFLYAPLFHPVMCKVLKPETELGIKTIFYTIIGPLINPALAKRHLMGVYKPELLDMVSLVARDLGYTRALFVHGTNGLDELSLLGASQIYELRNGQISRYELRPEQVGLGRCRLEDIATGTPAANAEMIRAVFSGKDRGHRRDAILLNTAGALYIGDRADSIKQGVQLAAELVDGGNAERKLKQLVEASHDFAARRAA